MADAISTDVPFVDVRQEGDKWNGYITQPWFRYLIASNPDGFGTGSGVLHGNATGAPTWGPVDLASEVSGVLPVANGGLGGITVHVGGLLYFQTGTAVSSTLSGATTTVLHGGGGGAPTFDFVHLDRDTAGVLPVAHGGTGVTSSTGTGSNVLSDVPSLNSPNINAGTFTGPTMVGPDIIGLLAWIGALTPKTPQLQLNASMDTTINVGPTTLTNADEPTFFVIQDKTNAGMVIGVMDPLALAPSVTLIANTITGVTFSRLGFSGLQALVTAAPFVRRFVGFAVTLGA